MKKIILSLILVISFTFTFAQKKNVSKAKNKALMETPDFAGAREDIKLAFTDPTTNNLAETYYVAGLIGYKENDVMSNMEILGKTFDKDAKGLAILESYNYFLKAAKLDSLPDAKGKVKLKYTKDIASKVKEYYTGPGNLIAYGAYLFEKKDYEKTIKAFETFLEIADLPMMKNSIPKDSTYNMITYYTAIAATNANNPDKAIGYYEKLLKTDYQSLAVHQLLYEQYQKKKDTVNFVRVLKAGFDKFPSELWFLQNLINYFINSSKVPDALVYLNTAIERQPEKAEYRYVKGNLDESQGNFESALSSFNKAIELDPKLADAYSGIGRLYYNKAVKISEEANNIKDNKKYNAELSKAETVFKEALPFFVKASKLKPEDVEHKRTLKTLYYRLKMDAEFEAISKEIDAMK